LAVDFPPNYPFTPPNLHFTTRMFHPNVTDDGQFLSDLCNFGPDSWNPSGGVRHALLHLTVIFDEIERNLVANEKAFDLHVSNFTEFYNVASEWTQLYAQEP